MRAEPAHTARDRGHMSRFAGATWSRYTTRRAIEPRLGARHRGDALHESVDIDRLVGGKQQYRKQRAMFVGAEPDQPAVAGTGLDRPQNAELHRSSPSRPGVPHRTAGSSDGLTRTVPVGGIVAGEACS